jgi:hypothetical protein
VTAGELVRVPTFIPRPAECGVADALTFPEGVTAEQALAAQNALIARLRARIAACAKLEP